MCKNKREQGVGRTLEPTLRLQGLALPKFIGRVNQVLAGEVLLLELAEGATLADMLPIPPSRPPMRALHELRPLPPEPLPNF